jgi:NAD(P) transhydrogenase
MLEALGLRERKGSKAMSANHYDLVVIGSGPAGQKGAIAAAKLGKRVAVVDRKEMVGGVCVHTGTIPSKTLREAILYLSGFRQRTFYGKDYTVMQRISAKDLAFRVQAVVGKEVEVVRNQLRRNGVTTIAGQGRFVDPHTVEVETEQGPLRLNGDYILIACGTRSACSPTIAVDGRKVFDADQLQYVSELPRELIVVGAGVIGLEYASMLTALDIKVTIIDQRPTLLDFVDREIIDALMYHMRRRGATFRLGETVTSVGVDEQGRVAAMLESGKRVVGQALLYTVGRQSNSDLLNLEAAGLAADPRGRIVVNAHFQTAVAHIYAAGDVIGFPSLASSSTEQGRLAGNHMFGLSRNGAMPKILPYGIYTVPEISMVGATEQELTESKTPYESGIAKYEELARGQILGDETGLLKLLFDPKTLLLLGVHVIGEGAAEIVHIGQTVLALGGTIEYFRDTVFNYPTLAEAYKVAALAGLNRL